jgi:hypothetical protein
MLSVLRRTYCFQNRESIQKHFALYAAMLYSLYKFVRCGPLVIVEELCVVFIMGHININSVRQT